MIKYLIVIINTLVVLIYGWFTNDGNITLSGNFPKSIKPGTEVPVELTVKKGNLGGFAKLQIELPEGLSVKESDNKGANFSYNQGLAKWIWTALPSETDVVVKFILVADASASGSKTIGGKFSYVDNNSKQVAEMSPVELMIGNENDATVTTTASSAPETPATPVNNAPTTTSEPAVMAGGEPTGNINATRRITPLGNNEYQIDIKIKKDGTKGFARYSDNLPEGYTARQLKTDGSSFSVADGKIKFVWVSVPASEELAISYVLKGSSTKAISLNGEYSYLEDNQSKKVKPNTDELPASAEVAASGNPPTTTSGSDSGSEKTAAPANTSAPAKSETSNSTPANTNTAETSGKIAETTTSNTEKDKPTTESKSATSSEKTTIANTTSPSGNTENTSNSNAASAKTEATLTENLNKKEGKVNYAVQVGAFTNASVNASTLSGKFNLTETVKSEMADGFHKFIVGSHSEYKQARDHRESVRNNNGIRSAFVVAYNAGRRITVQEALTISNQKWFK